MSTRPTKVEQVRVAMRLGHWEAALRLAARFPILGKQEAAIKRAHEAYHYPRFFLQLGYDVEKLKAAGRAALVERFDTEKGAR